MNPRRIFALALAVLLMAAMCSGCLAVERADYNMPYYITVDISNQIVTVYDSQTDGVVRQMLCSTGRSDITPTGTFTLPRGRRDRDRKPWYYIAMYHRYVKYATRILGEILFHSIPYTRQSLQSIDAQAAKELGWPTSHGCIRLRWQDAAFIAENCLPGTVVKIYKGAERDEGLRELLYKESYDAASGLSYDSYLGISREEGALARYSEGEEVLNLQRRLRDLGLYDGELNGVYDSATVNAVRTAQYISGDELNGVATLDYQKKLYGPDAPVAMEARLSESMSGPAVRALQENLRALRLYDGELNTVYDAAVIDAVRQFQRAYGYEVDGVAEPIVQKAVAYEAGRLGEAFGDSDYSCAWVVDPVLMAKVGVKEGARLREGPSPKTRQLRRLSEGRAMLVLDKGDEWSRVKVGGDEGYVRNDLLSYYHRMIAVLKYTSATEDLVYTIGNDIDDYRAGAELPCELFETYLAANDQNVDVNSLTNYITVNTGEDGPPLNLREAPDGESAVLDTVDNGVSLPSMRRASEWTQVRYRGKVGYLLNRYLTFWTGPEDALDETLDAAEEDLPATGYAAVRSASGRQAAVYEADLDDAAILGHLPDGTRLEVLEIADGWCHIRYEGHEGYMIGEDLLMEQTAAEEAPEEAAQP